MKRFIYTILALTFTGCGSGFRAATPPPTPNAPPTTMFPISSAIVSINAKGDLAALKLKKDKFSLITSLLMSSAHAQVVQANGVVSVIYSNPGATSFTLNTTGFMSGAYPQVSGNDLQLGTIAVSALDDNSLKVCTGVGAPGNKCNRVYIRVFTLGSNVSNSITGVPGFINIDAVPPYGIDVLAGSVLTPIGYNASASAASVTDAAQVFSYTIPNNLNRVRLTNTGAISFPLKADLTNAGAGNYEMRLAIQYALAYVP